MSDSPEKRCCHRDPCDSVVETVAKLAVSTAGYHPNGSYSSERSLDNGTSEVIGSTTDDWYKESYSNSPLKPSAATSSASSPKIDDCSRAGCCGGKHLVPATESGVAQGDNISGKACGMKQPSASSLSSKSYTETLVARVTGTDDIDIEKGRFQAEHVVLSVRGMDCTGCEKKLSRSLASFPAISNVKTSLVLSQAEFDLSGSHLGDYANIIKTIEKMTGFTCTKMIQSGQELDMTVRGNVQDFALEKDFPLGITDLTILDKGTIRVNYDPKIIGARELVADPFFRSAELAPAIRPQMASGRAHVRVMLVRMAMSALLTIPVLVLAWATLPAHRILYGAISLALATIVQIAIAGHLYTGALKALIFSRVVEMDLLIVLSTGTAYLYSVIAYAYLVVGKPLWTGEFFETSTLLVTLIMVGRAVSALARQGAVESIFIESMQQPTALLIDPESHQEQEIDARLLQYEDTFKVLPDSSIVTDGVVTSGSTEVDESMITGEATLVEKRPGSSVIAGSINHSGTLTVRLTRLPGENTIVAMESMVDEAISSKPRVQEIADRVASYFVPLIFTIAAMVFVVWVAIGTAVRHQSATTACVAAMIYAMSALVVSCPCAIGLAVPLVVAIAGGVAAKHGIVFKSAETIEIARNVSHVIFDKTGTLTQGKLSVVAREYPKGGADSLAPMLLGLTTNSKHPVSAAVAAHIKALGFRPVEVENVASVAGSGTEAAWNGRIIRAGNPYWLGFEDSPVVRKFLFLGLTTFCVSVDGEFVAAFGLQDTLRPDAIQTVHELKKRSVQVSIVSGDNEEAVKSVAGLLDIPESHLRFRCSPADKQAYVREMLVPENSIVMFCGDGTNDAVALSQANIGMHMSGGTDIARSAADAVLVRPSLSGILSLMDLSKAFYRRVVLNFIWAFAYNVSAILLAAGVFRHAQIPLQYAGLGEIVSVLPVIAIAMQLKWTRLSW